MDTESTISKETTVVESPVSNSTAQVVTTKVAGDPVEFSLFKINQIIWYIVGLIVIVIGLRFILLLLAAGNAGFVNFIYNLSDIFVAPFFGIHNGPKLSAFQLKRLSKGKM